MKKFILTIIIAFAFVALASAQKVYDTAVDTLNGAETVLFPSVRSSSSSGTLAIQGTCTNLGGVSDGTLILQGSVDGVSYNTINSGTDKFVFYPNDTLTITDGAVIQVVITNSPFKDYRWKGVGTDSDTTLVETSFLPKLK